LDQRASAPHHANITGDETTMHQLRMLTPDTRNDFRSDAARVTGGERNGKCV